MYQRQGKVAYKANLNNTILLDDHLGNPHERFPTIHVAGTNGKGSTCHMLASVLQEAGYKVGLYTSPHLKDFRERIKINGEMCSQAFVVDFVQKHKEFLEANQLSFFEMTVGMAFQYFAEQKVDIAVIETGLGGRLDSTNIIKPLVCAITNIDKDHTAVLGNTLVKIAGEKAGIIKENTPVAIGEKRSHLKSRFRESADKINAPVTFVNHQKQALPTDLLGSYQKDNVRVATAVIQELNKVSDFTVSDEDLKSGLKNIVKNTRLRGRYDVLQLQPKVVCDTAHNVAGIKMVMAQVDKEEFETLHIVLGMVADKNIDAVLSLLPKHAIYHICRPDIPRGLAVEALQQAIKNCGLVFTSYSSVHEAYQGALKMAKSQDMVLATGSTFVVAEII
ncbi:bifunctional folylpolyglutamate synthase/dihydrofolate synthase [Nonlabens spongiae]|nr:folylpolyglutamate synthase/dihydrofolate synthase family protein [Nonlabens spongiae]